MPKRKRKSRNKRRDTTATGRPTGLPPIFYQQVTSPDAVIPRAQFDRWKRLLTTDAKGEFEREIQRLETIVLSTDPILLLSTLSAYQFHNPGINPEYTFTDPLLQFHLEWLQGYCLRFDLTEYARPTYLGSVLKETTERLKRIAILSAIERWQRTGGAPGSGKPVLGTWEQELTRAERLALRNWGYADQMISLVGKLCDRLDAWAEDAFGHPLSPLLPLVMSIVTEVERRYNAQRREVQSVFQHTKSEIGLCRRWQRSTLPGTDRVDELEAGLREGTVSPDDIVREFVRSYEGGFPSIFTFSSQEVAELSAGAYSAEQCEQILNFISLDFESLKESQIDYLTLGNPVWTKPFIRLDNDAYFCPVPGMLLSHCMDLMESFVVPRDEERWWAARSAFLEQQLDNMFSLAFPSAEKRFNSKWIDPSDNTTVYENDLALLLGDVVLAVEAKAHRVPAAVRRGAPKGMRETIEEMVVQPSAQSRRFCQYLLAVRGQRSFFSDNDGPFVIDSSTVRSVVRINAVLDSFAVASVSTVSLRAAGLLREHEPGPAPTLLLSDLQTILFLLPDELQRLHYLSRRAVLQERLDYQADEIDLLALYIEAGFAWGGLEATGEKLLIRGIARSIDPYLEQHYAGKAKGRAPRRPLHRLWSNTLGILERETPPDWVSIGTTLLDASFEQQEAFSTAVKDRIKEVKKSDEIVLADGWTAEVGNSLLQAQVIGIVTKGDDEDVLEGLIETRIRELHTAASLDAAVLVFDASSGPRRPTSIRFAPPRDESDVCGH